MPKYTRARDFGRTTRIGRDQEEEEGREELRQMLNDGDVDFGDLIAACIKYAPEHKQEELHGALRELGEDARRGRSYHKWARDRLELRRHGRDRKKLGRDLSAEELTAGRSTGPEDFERSTSREAQSLDRRTAHDMAMDSKARRSPALASFRQRYPGASRIERF